MFCSRGVNAPSFSKIKKKKNNLTGSNVAGEIFARPEANGQLIYRGYFKQVE